MNIIGKGILGGAFLIATDFAVAAATGFTGTHGMVVDLGAKFGEAVGISQVDWYELLGLEEIEHAAHSGDHSGHNHAEHASNTDNCHYEPNGEYHCGTHDEAPQITETKKPEPTLEFE